MALSADGGTTSGHWISTGLDLDVNMNLTTGFTVAAWLKFDVLADTNDYAFFIRDSNNKIFAILRGYDETSYGGSSSGQCSAYTSDSSLRTNSQVTVPDTGWHHYAWRLGAGNRTTGVTWDKFLDGAKTSIHASKTQSSDLVGGIGKTVDEIGLLRATASANVDGALQEVAVWNTALTDEQIAMLASGCTAHWFYSELKAHICYPESEGPGRADTRELLTGGLITTGDDTWIESPPMYRPAPPFYPMPGASGVVLSGTGIGGYGALNQPAVVAGGKTIIITLTGGKTFVAAGTGPIGSTADTQALIDAFTSEQSETYGWNNEVRDKELTSSVTRDSDTQATLTLSASPDYAITAPETINFTCPGAVLSFGAGGAAKPFSVVLAFEPNTPIRGKVRGKPLLTLLTM